MFLCRISKSRKNKSCFYKTPYTSKQTFQSNEYEFKLGGCMMKVSKELLKKYSEFIVEEILFNRGQSLLKKELPFLQRKKQSELSTLLLTETEYDNLIPKILFQMENKYLNYNYYDDLYIDPIEKEVNRDLLNSKSIIKSNQVTNNKLIDTNINHQK